MNVNTSTHAVRSHRHHRSHGALTRRVPLDSSARRTELWADRADRPPDDHDIPDSLSTHTFSPGPSLPLHPANPFDPSREPRPPPPAWLDPGAPHGVRAATSTRALRPPCACITEGMGAPRSRVCTNPIMEEPAGRRALATRLSTTYTELLHAHTHATRLASPSGVCRRACTSSHPLRPLRLASSLLTSGLLHG